MKEEISSLDVSLLVKNYLEVGGFNKSLALLNAMDCEPPKCNLIHRGELAMEDMYNTR